MANFSAKLDLSVHGLTYNGITYKTPEEIYQCMRFNDGIAIYQQLFNTIFDYTFYQIWD